MIQTWLVIVAVFFVLAEAFLWIKSFILPLPVYILAGAFLSIISNYDRGMMDLFREGINSERKVISQTASLIEDVKMFKAERTNQKVIEAQKNSDTIIQNIDSGEIQS